MDFIADVTSQVLQTSTGSSSSEDECDSPIKKKPRRQFDWELIDTFTDLDAAKLFLTQKKLWILRSTKFLCDAKKYYYDCTVGKTCSAKRYVLHTATKTELYEANTDHDHSSKKQGLTPDEKAKIKHLYSLGVTKPKKILEALIKDGIEPKRSQITSYIQHNIRNKEAPRIVFLGNMESVCKEHATPPEMMDTPYVISHQINYENKSFRIAMSTKRLLSQGAKSEAVQADATYKLMWEGFPVLMLGASDKDRKFHPLCVAITSNETHDDYAFCFSALQSSIPNYKPTILIADCAEAITNGFMEVFGDNFQRVHCWAHVYRKLSSCKYIKELPKSLQDELLSDISVVQLCKSDVEFSAATKLFKQKWQERAPAFCRYLFDEYIYKNNGWYEGKAPGYPSTNNGLESTNRVIKSEGTYNERVSFGLLLQTLMRVLKSWSEERNPAGVNFKEFSEKPSINLKMQTKAHQLASSCEVKFRHSANKTFFFIPAFKGATLRESIITRYVRMSNNSSWRTFGDYKTTIQCLWKVEMSNGNWEESTCTCRNYQKEYICVHIIGIAIKKRLYQVPREAEMIPIGQKRKRGRPQKSKPALIVQ